MNNERKGKSKAKMVKMKRENLRLQKGREENREAELKEDGTERRFLDFEC